MQLELTIYSRSDAVHNFCVFIINGYSIVGGCRGHDNMVVGFTTTYAISAYHH
jgi:hypothetical protein